MLTDPQLRSQVDQLWDKLWSGGLSNPLDAIEQFSYLLFLKRLEDEENRRASQARRRNEDYTPQLDDNLRWSIWTQFEAKEALKHVKEVVFPAFKTMADELEGDEPQTKEEEQAANSFAEYMAAAEFKINKPSLLIEACNLIDALKISQQNQDVQGDLYEYMLNKLSTAGRNGQFRTPRHIIRMMLEMRNPSKHDRIGDLAAGTGGFLVNAYQYIVAQNTSEELLEYDDTGEAHGVGDLLSDDNWTFLKREAFRGYDNDSGMTMLRIGSMNLMLHGIEFPQFYWRDTLSQDFDEPDDYDVILMNPPFKGSVDKNTLSPHLPSNTTKSELLFIHQILRVLDSGGRAAVIVPDGVLFGSSNAHRDVRQKLVEDNQLEGVVSMPSGVFKPYAGVSTAVLFFTKGGTTEKIWFYDMAYDGFSLDDKRQPTPHQNDLHDLIACWQNKDNPQFVQERAEWLAQKQAEIEPLHAHRLDLEQEINRLQFEKAVAERDNPAPQQALEAAQQELDELQAELQPRKAEIDQLTRQFWVTKKQVKANKYDLSASRYREVAQDPVFYEDPDVTIERMLILEQTIADSMRRIQERLNK